MNEHPLHILSQSGILTTFSISKKISEREINAMTIEAKNQGKNEKAIVEILRNKIMAEIIDAVKQGTVPGVLVEKGLNPPLPVRFVEELNKLALMIGSKFASKKHDKLSMCYFINYLVNIMGLTEEDFEDFHRKMQEENGEDDDDE